MKVSIWVAMLCLRAMDHLTKTPTLGRYNKVFFQLLVMITEEILKTSQANVIVFDSSS